MDTAILYNTFTRPKVVTSMLLTGIALGLTLSALVSFFSGQWFLPVAFAGIALGTVILYMVWLDRQEFREEVTPDIHCGTGPDPCTAPVLVRPPSPPVTPDIPGRLAIFSDRRIIGSMVLLSTGLGFALSVVIILFRETWYLPALVAGLTIGTVVAYLCWLDGLDTGSG